MRTNMFLGNWSLLSFGVTVSIQNRATWQLLRKINKVSIVSLFLREYSTMAAKINF